jgi:hypothetical protein
VSRLQAQKSHAGELSIVVPKEYAGNVAASAVDVNDVVPNTKVPALSGFVAAVCEDSENPTT